jgi:hypothetical protein
VDKRAILHDLSFGARIAEEEGRELTTYFVETDHWRRIYAGETDVIYGAKGAGKSAVYALLMEKQGDLFDQGIIAIGAENPRGTPAFRELVVDPPATEHEFTNLWKLYILSLLAEAVRDYGLATNDAKAVIAQLENAGLLPRDSSLAGRVKAALAYARSIIRFESLQGEVKLDPVTGTPTGVTGKITLRDPGAGLRAKGWVSADELLSVVNKVLGAARLKVWILFDRLDVAFAEQQDLEQNALRALFKVYLDLAALENMKLKIFIRTDIWQRITQAGFREGSHITRHVTIEWDEPSLLNLIVRRIVRTNAVNEAYGVKATTVLADIKSQRDLFYRIFPGQVDPGAKRRETFNWTLSRTADGLNREVPAPRELIHLFAEAKNQQLQKMSTGEDQPEGQNLVSATAIKDALPEVSRVRFEQTLLAEYPEYAKLLRRLEGEHTQQTPDSLAKLWQMDLKDAMDKANALSEIGFFSAGGSKEAPLYWVPFLYRSALKMVQGTAE